MKIILLQQISILGHQTLVDLLFADVQFVLVQVISICALKKHDIGHVNDPCT